MSSPLKNSSPPVVLVTGATGFIGRHAIQPLLDAGFAVHITSLPDAPIPNIPPALRSPHEVAAKWGEGGIFQYSNIHPLNLLNHDRITELIHDLRPSHLLHFAWIATPGIYQTAPENKDWKDASLHLFAECEKNGCQRIVSAGTCFEYEWNEETCIENKTPLKPTTFYGQMKKETGEDVGKMDISSAWGRIFFLYGPHEAPTRLVASVIRSLIKNERAECTHGRQIRDFLHVQDVADAFVALLQSDVRGPVNIASGNPVTIGALVRTIGKLMGKEDLIALGAKEAPANEPPRITAAMERLQKEVGWKPRFDLENGLQDAIAWWKRLFNPETHNP